MAAIAGVVGRGGEEALRRAMAHVSTRMRHRGPEVASWGDGQQCLMGQLGEPMDGPVQPPQELIGEGDFLLVVDGRIDDRPGLIADLALPKDWEGPDRALFAQAWRLWREGLGDHIVGDFALAVWEPGPGVLWLLRDRAGVRPLYWAPSSGGFVVASQPEALLGLPGVSMAPDEAHVRYVLAPQLGDGPLDASWYQDVRKVPAGHWVRLDQQGVKQQRWWHANPGPTLQLDGPDDYCEAFREVFGKAVTCRLERGRPTGLLLSGGIDSAAVLAMVRRGRGVASDQRLRPVSIVGEDAVVSEENSNILAMLASEPDAIRVPVPSFGGAPALSEMARLPWSPPHPVDNSVVLPMAAYRAAREAGIRVMLDGIDGDQITSAPDDYVGRMALTGSFRAAWREATHAAQHHTYLQHRAPAWILLRGLAPQLAPAWAGSARLAWNLRLRRRQPLGRLRSDLAEAAVWRQEMEHRARERRRAVLGKTIPEQLVYSWVHSGLFRGLESYDHAAARFGIETRHPWCDQRVMDFFLRLPLSVKVRDGWTKWVVRAASAPWLPAPVAWHAGKYHLGSVVVDGTLSGLQAHQRVRLARDMQDVLAPWVRPDLLMEHTGRLRTAKPTYDTYDLASLGAWLAWLGQGAGSYDLG